MKSLLITLLLIILPASALAGAPQIAEEASQVTPLLNGMKVPDVTVRSDDGAPVSLRAITMQKPSVILFYRGGWCPYCNRQLAGLKDIESKLTDLGYQIIAISPQSGEELKAQQLKTDMAAMLYTDSALNALKGFGIGYHVDTMTATKYKAYNIALAKDSEGKPVLPAPALFIIGTDGVIQFSYVNPDYKVRPSAQLVLAVAQVLAEEATAKSE